LIVCGNAGVESHPLGVAKNLAELYLRKSLFCGTFPECEIYKKMGGRKLMIVAKVIPRHPCRGIRRQLLSVAP
jgi:hypothetical protein